MRKTKLTLCTFAASTFLFLPGCGGSEHNAGGSDEVHSEDDGHNHGAKKDNAHSDDDGHGHGSDVHELGSVTAAGTTFSVKAGHVEAGAEMDVELERSSGAKPTGIRIWVGLESGVGSLKVKANPDDEHIHVHVEVPKELNSEAQLWVQVEAVSGETETRSLALPKEDHEH